MSTNHVSYIQTNKISIEENSAYEQYGEESKDKILRRIINEGIQVNKSFDYSVLKTASYKRFVVKSGDNSKKESYHMITIPTFTDESNIMQTITLSHELGHYYVLKEASKLKENLLLSGFKTATYVNEKLAWKKAEEILKKEGIIDKNGSDFQRLAFQEFNLKKETSINSYGNPFLFFIENTLKIIWFLFKVFIITYLLTAFSFIFVEHKIPPFDNLSNELKTEDFKVVYYSYLLIVISFYLIAFLPRKLGKSLKK